ncbi:hypothetical protein [Novosphingobium sp. PY1]|uniref:Pectate lyase superfamily protein domain-containing protein n=1 Tax=Ochrobactrum sp. PW1 TaxID=1882222 RepID=A0A292GSE6_9HYPH|nr:hypothetical protein [Novosphingobium sp. PY1]BBA74429.1 hypothetical protein [Ochrobactrum sp. PW1]GFM29278.1 uncharacterized protein PY1_contig-07-204 [Novosphingobium sp. PY1]
MAVSTTNAFSGPYLANGATTVFPFTFTAPSAAEVAVLVRDADGAAVDAGTYSVSITAGGGGSVSFDVAPDVGLSLVILLDPEFTQGLSFENGSAWLAEPVNEGYDRSALRDQVLKREVDRGLKFPFGETETTLPPASERYGKFLGFSPIDGSVVLAESTSGDDLLRPELASTDPGKGAALVAVDDGESGSIFSNLQVFVSKILSSAGTAIIGFAQAGVGAVLRSLEAKLREISVSVTDFGADNTGAIDASTAVLAAVTALIAAGGGFLDFPAGDYLLESRVDIVADNIILRGVGHGRARIINGQANDAAIKIGDGLTQHYRCGVRDMIFGQSASVTASTSNCGLYVQSMSNCVFSNVYAYQFPGALTDGLKFDAVVQSYAYNLAAQDCLALGTYFRDCLDFTWLGGRSDANGTDGIYIEDSAGLYWTGVTAYGNARHAWNIDTDGTTLGNTFHFFTNCIGDTSGNTNWRINHCYESVYTGCWGCTQGDTGVNTTAAGFHVTSNNVDGLRLIGCFATSNNGHGIFLEYGLRIAIDGCMTGSGRQAFSANGKGGAGSGIRIGAGAARVNVSGGSSEGNTDYGIDIAAGAQFVQAQGVELRYNSAGSVRNLANASAANAVIKDCPGFNPVGYITPPSVPASGTAVTNLSGQDVMVYLAGGTLTANVEIGGAGVLQATNTGYLVPAGSTIKLTYSVAPTWAWSGL